MNNKGFAITTILYGIMVLFCVLLVSLLGILSSYKKTQAILTEKKNGTRDIISLVGSDGKKKITKPDEGDPITGGPGRVMYCKKEGSIEKCCYTYVIGSPNHVRDCKNF